MEQLTLEQLTAYIVALQTLDFGAIAVLNHHSRPEQSAVGLERHYWSEAERLKESVEWKWMTVDHSYIESIYYQEITCVPTMDDILRVAYQSRDALMPEIMDEPEVVAAMTTDIQYLKAEIAKLA